MKRELDNKEKKLTVKGIKRVEKEISELQNNLNYNQSLIAKQEYLRDFDDNWRSYLREVKDKEDKNVLKQMQELINQKKEIIENMKNQLKDGVEPPACVK